MIVLFLRGFPLFEPSFDIGEKYGLVASYFNFLHIAEALDPSWFKILCNPDCSHLIY